MICILKMAGWVKGTMSQNKKTNWPSGEQIHQRGACFVQRVSIWGGDSPQMGLGIPDLHKILCKEVFEMCLFS